MSATQPIPQPAACFSDPARCIISVNAGRTYVAPMGDPGPQQRWLAFSILNPDGELVHLGDWRSERLAVEEAREAGLWRGYWAP
jgi:hypothetical protein